MIVHLICTVNSGKPRDRWFTTYVVFAAAMAVSPLIISVLPLNPIWGLAAFLLIVLTLASGPFLTGWALAKHRPKFALSALLGMALIVSDLWTLPVAGRAIEDFVFRLHQSAFDEAVALERRKEGPARLC